MRRHGRVHTRDRAWERYYRKGKLSPTLYAARTATAFSIPGCRSRSTLSRCQKLGEKRPFIRFAAASLSQLCVREGSEQILGVISLRRAAGLPFGAPVGNGGSYLKDAVGPLRRPAHSSSLVRACIDRLLTTDSALEVGNPRPVPVPASSPPTPWHSEPRYVRNSRGVEPISSLCR